MRRFLIIVMVMFLAKQVYSQETTDNSFTMVDFKNVSPVAPESLEGSWKLVSFDYYKDDMIIDSARILQGYQQVKIFQNGYVMWSREVPTSDLEEWYGFGKYQVLGDTLIEKLEFGSHALMRRFNSEHSFLLRTTGKDRFRQIRFDKNGRLLSSENYIRLPPSTSED